MGPNCWNFLGNSLTIRDCPELRGCLGLFNSGIFSLNHVLDVNKCREWVVGRFQNMGSNYGKYFWTFGLSVNPQKNQWAACVEIVL